RRLRLAALLWLRTPLPGGLRTAAGKQGRLEAGRHLFHRPGVARHHHVADGAALAGPVVRGPLRPRPHQPPPLPPLPAPGDARAALPRRVLAALLGSDDAAPQGAAAGRPRLARTTRPAPEHRLVAAARPGPGAPRPAGAEGDCLRGDLPALLSAAPAHTTTGPEPVVST